MASANSTTSARPENRVFIFLALSRADRHATPHREQVIAKSEREARLMLVGRYVLSFAGCLPVREVHHG
ncbi:host cell division inhibitor Icd-like protein [Salmonella enterica]|nr:host cell division inhibitor Icd-like protein [Salmonella enterica subsp. enterica serovar Thompson]EDW1373362.1 host cell division inhibitor Icd-like protein [Salmonella enterica subsp. enterica]EHI5878933.1 host cell division inhibitor Icd-like protein [Salmonella enterica]EDW0274943.1 host cell division inhibitor Icd-like protein [Salmonella enterica subsp. enterica serovar Thompson]EEC5263055.1 host cell division inhibitor Icd-like protein [Salmonella enterica subsp. enterica]